MGNQVLQPKGCQGRASQHSPEIELQCDTCSTRSGIYCQRCMSKTGRLQAGSHVMPSCQRVAMLSKAVGCIAQGAPASMLPLLVS